MPINPASFVANSPLTAKILNTALYTYSPGNNFTPNGLLFHSMRPLLVESMQTVLNQASSTAGTYTNLGTSSTGNWFNWFDSSVILNTSGSDFQSTIATGRFSPTVTGTDGTTTGVGGYYLVWTFPVFNHTTNANCSGSGLSENGTTTAGGHQLSSITHSNCAYTMDIITGGSGQFIIPQGYCADASGSNFTYNVNTADYSGQTSRFYAAWLGIATGGTTLGSIPTPTAWSATSTVTASTLNGAAITQPLQLLNFPPILRASGALSTSITNGTQTTVALNTANIDTYAGYNTSTHVYTVPVTGVYLAHGFVYYNSSSTGTVYAGISVNGGTAFFGPAYTAPSANSVGPCVTLLLDLQAGDTVTLVTFSSVTQTLGSAFLSRLCLAWMGVTAGSNNSVSFTPPVTGFRWQAGTPGTSLVTQFQQRLTNDLSFMLQRPYLMTIQTVAQTGLTQNAFHTVVLDTVQGPVHASAGDNYGGWTSGSSNKYTAVRSGWYLVLGRFLQVSSSVTMSLVAGFTQSPAGLSSPDQYQHISATTSTLVPGAEAVGMYYLRAGDTIQPQYQQQDGDATFATSVTTGHRSTFGCIWLSE